MNPKQFRDFIIVPTLNDLNLYSDAASNLILGTIAQESDFQYVQQLGKGPASGLIQMEPATHRDIWFNYLPSKPDLIRKICRFLSFDSLQAFYSQGHPYHDELRWNLVYNVMMCRIYYLRVPERLPAANDIPELARYWKQYYNTYKGKGTEQQFIDNFPIIR